MKKCIKCNVEKELDEFPKHPSAKDGYRNCCKKCNAAIHHQYHLTHYKYAEKKPLGKWNKSHPDYKKVRREHYQKNKERMNQKKREWRNNNLDKDHVQYRKDALKRMYGITLDQFNEKIKNQNNKCPICLKEFDNKKHKSHLDHNHTTKQVRSVLCVQCNLGLGRFFENVKTLQSASGYLHLHSKEKI